MACVYIYYIMLLLTLICDIDEKRFQVSFCPSRLLLLPFLVSCVGQLLSGQAPWTDRVLWNRNKAYIYTSAKSIPWGSSARHIPWRSLSRKSSKRKNFTAHSSLQSLQQTAISSSRDWWDGWAVGEERKKQKSYILPRAPETAPTCCCAENQ